MDNRVLNKNEIMKRLDGSIELFLYDETESTNNAAFSMGLDGKGRLAVAARQQTGGKGTHGRSFFCEKDKGLYLSCLYRPEKGDEGKLALITPLAAVVTAEAIEAAAGLRPKIKWINDLTVEDRKICGILCEASLNGGKADFVVIGIGINLFEDAFPDELRDTAVSLHEITEKAIDVNELCAQIVKRLFRELDEGAADIIARYRAYSSIIGRKIAFDCDKKRRQGIAKEINDKGNLIVESDEKRIVLFSSDANIKLIN